MMLDTRMPACALVLIAALATPARAQQVVIDGKVLQPPVPELDVRTFELRNITAADAAALIAPYITSSAGGVFTPERGIARAITVRETPRVLVRIDSVLRALDRPRPTVRLRFQLIAAEEQAGRDPRIASLDSTLRDLFRFQGYRLLAQTSVVVSEHNDFVQTFDADQRRLFLSGRVSTVTTDADSARVSLEVALSRPPTAVDPRTENNPAAGPRVLSTGLSIPIGQTVVLGSGVSDGAVKALILVVTPELAVTGPVVRPRR